MYIERAAGNRIFERPRHKWKCNLEMDLQEVGWRDMDWVHMAQDRDRC